MKSFLSIVVFCGLLGAFVSGVSAQEAGTGGGGFLTAPTLPPADIGGPGSSVERNVTIIETEKETIYEYRVNGQLYMIKVQPIAGPAYFFIDGDGDGLVDDRQEREPDLNVNQWIIHQW